MSDIAAIRAGLAGRYIIERELGRGGMATVYLARDIKHGRHVALKVLNAALNDSAGNERFLREIRTTARLTHPGILPLHDSGEVAGVPFYTMPWVDGETLRDLLNREGALPVERATQIAAAIADALAYAHENGVTHRDIKPENILIARSGHLWVSDFGLAHALAGSVSKQLSGGFALGSVHYMSPEQALGNQAGPPSDIYSLACVLYEMLTGKAPFDGPTASILSRHITEPAPHLNGQDASDSLSALLQSSLVKDSAQRPSARKFLGCLRGTEKVMPGSSSAKPRKIISRKLGVLTAAVAGVMLAALSLSSFGRDGLLSVIGGGGLADTTTYSILSFDGDSTHSADVTRMLTDALSRWNGVTVTDPMRVADVQGQYGNTSFANKIRAALALRTGRFITGSVVRTTSTINIRASVYSARSPKKPLRQSAIVLPADFSNADSLIAVLADSLLFVATGHSNFGAGQRGTHSAPALHYYLAAHNALVDWDVEAADSLFNGAIRLDPSYAQAQLWLAAVRQWENRPTTDWRDLADHAALHPTGLNSKEKALSSALSAMGNKQYVVACNIYQQVLTADPENFSALFGLGECNRRNLLVRRDVKSPSHWVFESSAWRALQAYRRAFELLPSSHQAFRQDAFSLLREKFFTSSTYFRTGRNEAGQKFVAYPEWIGDSLAFFPVPVLEAIQGKEIKNAAATSLAIKHTRTIFHEVTQSWVRAYPQAPTALEAEAVALEMLGDATAAQHYREARKYVESDDDYSIHLEVAGLWAHLKSAIPDDTVDLKNVASQIDTLFAAQGDVSKAHAADLAGLAALTGRAALAARLARASIAIPNDPAQTRINGMGEALLAFSSLNGPIDSIREAERRLDIGIRNTFPPAEWMGYRQEWIARSASISFPVYHSAMLTGELAAGDYVEDAELAFLRGDSSTANRMLGQSATNRLSIPASAWRTDALFPEAVLSAQLVGPHAVIQRLCPPLQAINWSEPGSFTDVAAAGTLPLSMLLYAKALEADGQREESLRWERVVAILWSQADPHLKLLRSTKQPFKFRPQRTGISPTPSQSCTPGGL